MEVREARIATSEEAVALLAALPPYRASEALAEGARLRAAGVDPDLAAAVLTQARLRGRARAKFGDFVEGLLFTPEGLEQATRLPVAALHGERYRAAALDRVADLTCGIGADALAMSALGIAVMAFERDEATALVADHNLRHWPSTVVVHADAMSVVREVDVDGIFADPSRRAAGGGRLPIDRYEPPLHAVLALRDTFPALGVKVGPDIAHAAIPVEAEAEWVSVDGEVVEAGLWFGPLCRAPGRAALVLSGGAAHRLASAGAAPQVGPLGDYLYEPDGAVIRAGLVAEIAEILGGVLVDARIAYVSGPRAVTPFATRYRILEDLPFGIKRLRSHLRDRGVGRLTIKKRGTAVTPEALRPQLDLKGDAEATIILTRVAGAQRVLVVEPD